MYIVIFFKHSISFKWCLALILSCHNIFMIGEDNCVGVDCQNGGSCQDGIDTFTCLCKTGYTGDLCATGEYLRQ